MAKELRVPWRGYVRPAIGGLHKLRQSLSRQMGGCELAYAIWAGAAASFGIAAGVLDTDVADQPIKIWALCAVLLAFGISLAAVRASNRRGKEWIIATLLGLFLSAVIIKYGILLGMALRPML
jgi:peptidoglycan/LPS O-acetylase OafA/YrhL